jgi:hypothetical protein
VLLDFTFPGSLLGFNFVAPTMMYCPAVLLTVNYFKFNLDLNHKPREAFLMDKIVDTCDHKAMGIDVERRNIKWICQCKMCVQDSESYLQLGIIRNQ